MVIRMVYILLLINPTLLSARQSNAHVDIEENSRGLYHHAKRDMLRGEHARRRRVPSNTQRQRQEVKKEKGKPSGHLAPLDEDDIDDDVMSVAIGPPSIRPKYYTDKLNPHRKPSPADNVTQALSPAASLIRDVLSQLGKEFLDRQVNEDFVFGQYVGNAMKNLTSDLRLLMQHDILDLITKYQTLNRGDKAVPKEVKMEIRLPLEKKGNDTAYENWPEFSNLANIIG